MFDDIIKKFTNLTSFLRDLPGFFERNTARVFLGGAIVALLIGFLFFYQHSLSLVHRDTDDLLISVEQINTARFNQAIQFLEEHNNPTSESLPRNPFTR